MKSRRSGLSLVVAGLLGIAYFWLTDPAQRLGAPGGGECDRRRQSGADGNLGWCYRVGGGAGDWVVVADETNGVSDVMMVNGVNFEEGRLAEFCRRHGIIRMSLFGSILSDRFGPESDIDLLVQFDPARRVSLFDVGGMTADLREMFGREVDLRTFEDLSIYFRDDVVRQARPLYAAA